MHTSLLELLELCNILLSGAPCCFIIFLHLAMCFLLVLYGLCVFDTWCARTSAWSKLLASCNDFFLCSWRLVVLLGFVGVYFRVAICVLWLCSSFWFPMHVPRQVLSNCVFLWMYRLVFTNVGLTEIASGWFAQSLHGHCAHASLCLLIWACGAVGAASVS